MRMRIDLLAELAEQAMKEHRTVSVIIRGGRNPA